MLSLPTLRNIRDSLEIVRKSRVPGDFVEAGCWRGGACVYARAVMDAYEDDRQVYGCDSFEGLPKPGREDDSDDPHHRFTALAADFKTVQGLPSKYGVSSIHWRQGFFYESLPKLAEEIGPIAVLRCDGDMYSSTWDTLTNLYSKVSCGGVVILDDWHLESCRRAVVDYLGFVPSVHVVYPGGAVMFRKPPQPV